MPVFKNTFLLFLRYAAAGAVILFYSTVELTAQSDPLVSMAESLKGNVVAIRAAFADGSEEQGFGFITGEQGGRLFIATAAHVVFSGRKASRIEVRFHNDVSWEAATYKAHWDQEDLALLEMSKPAWAGWRADCADFSPRNPQAVRFLGRYGSGQPRWVYPGPNGEVYELSGNTISFSINTILPGCSGAPLFNDKGIIGLVINDDQADSRALKLSRIIELFSNDGQYPYFGLRESGGAPPPVPSPVDDTPSGMALIRGGTYTMGCTAEQKDCHDDENPTTRVTVTDFYLGKFELTVREFQQFINATSYKTDADKEGWSYYWTGSSWEKKNGVNWKCDVAGNIRPASEYEHPVIHVSWNDAVAYCNWRSEKEGLTKVYTISGSTVTASWNANGYRLPTEAEWEYAARSGGKAVLFGNGKNIADPREINFAGSAPYKKDYSIAGEYRQKTVPVGSLNSPNALGLHDMSGNVWEWCWDWYDAYPGGERNNYRGPDRGSYRVCRGGSWYFSPQVVRVAVRSRGTPGYRYFYLGFRLARTP